MKKKNRLGRILYFWVNLSFLVPIVYLILRLIFGGGSSNEAGYHSDSDYLLMLMQCILGLVTIHLPSILERRLRFELPGLLYGFYIVFLYCAIFLGEVRSFYYLFPRWDSILHFFSSMMTGFFGLMVVTILNRDRHVSMNLSPLFVCLFAFCFSVTIGSLWEIYEFLGDGLFGLNMQKFMTAQGELLVGHDALRDTMKDIIVDVLGALLASVIGMISIRRGTRWYIPTLTRSEEEVQE
ncbi:MAG: hypothetical protein SOW29_00990 [Candidatus Faecousia sp.]|nr:hypothetical protein [Oscillospiraceae bacterium]MDD6855066.1 hypothetical protein [Oscillospiraceae bacterium]MDY2556915.1 hypothetical protein [Candidatus Faecousia sp.]